MSRWFVRRGRLASLICAIVIVLAGAPVARADDPPPPNLDQPPPNTDGSGRSRDFTRVRPSVGLLGGYTPYTVNDKPYELKDDPVSLPEKCPTTITEGSRTSDLREVRFVITGTRPNLENRADGEHAVFNSYLRAFFDFRKRDATGSPPDVTTKLETKTINFMCWVEGAPQPDPNKLRVHSPSKFKTIGRSSGGDAKTKAADGTIYVSRTNGDIDVNLSKLKDDLVGYAGEFTGTRRVVCQVEVKYELYMNQCLIKQGSYMRSFETTIIGTRFPDDVNRIDYILTAPQSGGELPIPKGSNSAGQEEPKDGNKKSRTTEEDKKSGDKKIGMVPGDSSSEQKEYAYKVAVQYPERCVATTYVRRENSGHELTGLQTDGPPVFEIGQHGSRPISAGPPPEPNRPENTDGNDELVGSEGPDEFTGGRGKDAFFFRLDLFMGEAVPGATLDDGDRITDYESGEKISIEGTLLKRSQVRLEYDKNNDQTRLGLDLNEDGTPDRTIILDGDQRGELYIHSNCCAVPTTEIAIKKRSQGQDKVSKGGSAPETTPPGPKSGSGKTTEAKPGTPAGANKDSPKSAPKKPATTTLPDKKAKTAETDKASQPGSSGKSTLPKTTPSDKKESKKPADNSDKPSDQSAVPKGGTGDSDLGLVKAELVLLALLVKGEGTGQVVPEFTWKQIDEDPKLPPDPKQPQPPSDAVTATNAYQEDLNGGESQGDGGATLISAQQVAAQEASAQPSGPADRSAAGTGKKPAIWEILENTTPQSHMIVALAKGSVSSKDMAGFAKNSLLNLGFSLQMISGYRIGDRALLIVTLPSDQAKAFKEKADRVKGVEYVEKDPCWLKEELNDPYFSGKGAWGQDFDDQWAIKRSGYDGAGQGAWKLLGDNPSDTIVAVIDTGLDWNHPDLAPDTLWRNKKEIPGNGRDDDGNGYVDDVIGWDFVDRDNRPWDHDGHGTFVTGVIAAAQNNGKGIAGINPRARIMVLRALDAFGRGHASMSAAAIAYAVDNGARVINLSLGGPGPSRTAQLAIDYAREKGAVVVVAAGNSGAEVAGFAPSGLDGVITVSASDRRDRRAPFSNWGPGIDISAPGIDVLSLRARKTDLLSLIRGVKYEKGAGIVGGDKAYYRASGTSFAAPFVTGTVSLLFSRNPGLTGEQATRMVLNSARDIETPGIDNFTGYGLLDAAAALKASPDHFVESRIAGVKVVRKNGAAHLRLIGTADADRFAGAVIQIGKGDAPERWSPVKDKIAAPVRNDALGDLPASLFRGAKQWTIRLLTTHKDGSKRESRFSLKLG